MTSRWRLIDNKLISMNKSICCLSVMGRHASHCISFWSQLKKDQIKAKSGLKPRRSHLLSECDTCNIKWPTHFIFFQLTSKWYTMRCMPPHDTSAADRFVHRYQLSINRQRDVMIRRYIEHRAWNSFYHTLEHQGQHGSARQVTTQHTTSITPCQSAINLVLCPTASYIWAQMTTRPSNGSFIADTRWDDPSAYVYIHKTHNQV